MALSVDDEDLARVVGPRRPSSRVGERAAGLDMPEEGGAGGAGEPGLGPRTNVNLPMESGTLPCLIQRAVRASLNRLNFARVTQSYHVRTCQAGNFPNL